jgi:large subunit ribosomal protein L34e
MKNTRIIKNTSFSYSTRSNKIRIIRTPGNNLRSLKITKKRSQRICPIKKCKIKGLNIPGSRRFSASSQKKRTISRAYGGCLSIHALRKNITKAFLLEEKRLAKKVLNLNNKKITK